LRSVIVTRTVPVMDYTLECPRHHTVTVDASEVQDILESRDFACPQCGEALELEGNLQLACTVCGGTYHASTLEEAAEASDEICSHCGEYMPLYYYVPNSFAARAAEYEWVRNGAGRHELERRGRGDYWEGLIHFCKRDEFISIIKEEKIRAGPTGLFRERAVCLTETPSTECAELQKKHGDHGFVFRKSDLMRIGGAPAIYLLPSMIEAQRAAGGFAAALRPYVNVLRTPKIAPTERRNDFLHEREWRVPCDIDLQQVRPFGIILPEGHRERFGGEDRETILGAAQAYEELG
jgi:hypothetical protein